MPESDIDKVPVISVLNMSSWEFLKEDLPATRQFYDWMSSAFHKDNPVSKNGKTDQRVSPSAAE